MTVGQRIKQRRIELGLTQSDLAKKMGYHGKSAVCAAETRDDHITTTKIKKFAEALNVTPRYLMGWEDINGVPISQPHVDYQAKISDYREEFVEEAIDLYRQIQKLPPDKKDQLESYLRFLQSQS